ncbi:putative alpha/Beta hydrolase [Plasmopara halstedii]
MRSPHCNNMDNAELQYATHLVVLQHGLMGSKHDFARFVEIFQTHFQTDELFLHATESNANGFFRTYDGVDQGGQRIADEIQQLAEKMPNLQKISMIGHSLGGLYNRFCIGLLLSRGFFDKVEPMNFITLASPHLGIRRPRRGATNVVFNALMPKIFSRSGAQLTLIDQASEETIKLSRPSIRHLKKVYYPALSEIEGLLLVSLPASEMEQDDKTFFEVFKCKVSDRKLCVYDNIEDSKHELKLEINLSCSEIQILLPSSTSKGDNAVFPKFATRQNGAFDKFDGENNFDVLIRWSTESNSDTVDTVKTYTCVLRIPEKDMQRDWKWLVVFSNASFGVRCLTATNCPDEAKAGKPSVPPLLSCLTRGHFNQALQLFKARTLYSSIFFDMQVPYTCAAVRAFNPYRLSAKKVRLSPTYTHIVHNSLKVAHKLRDTIPPKIQRLAMECKKLKRAAVFSPSNEDEQKRNATEAEDSDIGITSSLGSSGGTSCSASDFERKSTSSLKGTDRHKDLDHSRRRGYTMGSKPLQRQEVSRPEPFIEDDVIVDQLPYAFTSDAEQDELRGMLLSVQSVGWRRIDVLFGGVMSHEHIIAKRADLKKPLESGIDVVHHVMDTFMV